MTETQSGVLLQAGARNRRRSGPRLRASDVVWAVCLGLCALILLFYGWHLRSRASLAASGPLHSVESLGLPSYTSAPLVVLYAFFEKDVTQVWSRPYQSS